MPHSRGDAMTVEATSERPWYRHAWPWLLMLPPVSAMVFWSVILTTMAGPPDLVVDDYAKIGLSYTENRSRETAAAQLGVAARLRTDRESGHVSLLLTRPGNGPEHLRLTLTHPLETGRDRIVSLRRNAAGIYHGDIGERLDGRRRVLLEPADRTWRLVGDLPAAMETLQLSARKDRTAP